MPILVILKRVEVWLLLALVTGLVVFAFQTEPATELATGPDQPVAIPAPTPGNSEILTPSTKAENSITVQQVKVTPSGKGMIIELTLAGRSSSGSDITLDESTVSATTGEGETVPPFFEPFRESPLLLASEDSFATLRWWLESPADSILVHIQGELIKAELP